MIYKYNRCPICGSTLLKEVDTKVIDKDTFILSHCLACEADLDSLILKVEKKIDKPVVTNKDTKELNSEQIFNKCVNKIVEINTMENADGNSGTGFIIDDCHIVTNRHVVVRKGGVKKETRWYAKFKGDEQYINLELVGYSRTEDIAVLRAKPNSFKEYMRFSTRTIQEGEPCYVIGNAKGAGISMVGGLISDTSREVDGHDYMMISALIEGGNSGSPLIDKYGEVIGVAVASRRDATVMHYAIPYRKAIEAIRRIYNNAGL